MEEIQADIKQRIERAWQNENPSETFDALKQLIAEYPMRVDLRHALASFLLKMGEFDAALKTTNDALTMIHVQGQEAAVTLGVPLMTLKAECLEQLQNPLEANRIWEQALQQEPLHPQVLQQYGYFLLAWGKTKEALRTFNTYVNESQDDPDAINAHKMLIQLIEDFVSQDIDPKQFIHAHSDEYIRAFNEIADEYVEKGWIAEAARMKKNPDGTMSNIVPEDAKPYAATRVDLVDPQTGQGGHVGGEPLMVAISEELSGLVNIPVITRNNQHTFPLYVSTQTPWNHFCIQIRMLDDDRSVVDDVVGAWYTEGFNGAFGEKEWGRFHEISPPLDCPNNGVSYYVDCGRANSHAVEDLLQRLEILHSRTPISAVLLGNGKLPYE
jgi:tetratricopeptide (TPR) repeat protein